MAWLLRRPFVRGFLTAVALAVVAQTGRGQDKKDEAGKPEVARFDTADGAKIRGHFYVSAKKNAPVVMVLHALGEKSSQKGYTELAETLQKKEFNVLTFDFRGHGNSKEVESQDFWGNTPAGVKNRTYIKAASKTEIEFKEISKQGYSLFINDIAAAKSYLDRKHDKGECNSSNLVVIGAETGATLGTIWLNSEFYRYKYVPNPMGGIGKLEPRPEGLSTLCAIWLSISPDLGSRKITLSSVLDVPANQKAVPMVFMFSSDDAKGKKLASDIDKKIGTWVADKDKGKGYVRKNAEKYSFTGTVPIEKASKLVGSGLLQDSLRTDVAIAKYISDVLESRGKDEIIERDFRRSRYFWVNPSNPANPRMWIEAKPTDGLVMAWSSYEMFIR